MKIFFNFDIPSDTCATMTILTTYLINQKRFNRLVVTREHKDGHTYVYTGQTQHNSPFLASLQSGKQKQTVPATASLLKTRQGVYLPFPK